MVQNQRAARRLDFICGTVLAAASLITLLWIIPVAVQGEAAAGEVAPSFFPRLTAGMVLLCSLGMMIANRATLKEAVDFGGWVILYEVAGWGVVALCIMLLLNQFGLIAASIFASIMGTVVSRYDGRWWVPGAIAILLPFILTYLVRALFSIELP